jgi:hypothetical protein
MPPVRDTEEVESTWFDGAAPLRSTSVLQMLVKAVDQIEDGLYVNTLDVTDRPRCRTYC